MASEIEEKINVFLRSYLKKFNVTFDREVPAGFGSRFDFCINTRIPIVLEIQGEQHYKPNEFHFKTVDQFEHYKANDNFKKMLSYSGKIYLIEIRGDITYSEFERIMNDYDFMLEEGDFVAEEKKENTSKIETYKNRKEKNPYIEAQKERAKAYRKEQYRKFKEAKRNNKEK
jgi:hypothetical protein